MAKNSFDPSEFRRAVLANLYGQWLEGKVPDFNVREFIEKSAQDDKRVWEEINFMEEEGLIRGSGIICVGITANGIRAVETQKMVPEDNQIRRAQELREDLVMATSEGVSFHEFMKAAKISFEFACNLGTFLEDCGILRMRTVPPTPKLTLEGREFAAAILAMRSRTSTLNGVESLPDPHKRGREFQNFLAEMLEQEDWNPQLSTKSPGEELDIVVHRGREYYLLESKWRKEPVEAKHIRDFAGKLGDRAVIAGCFFSMSGFSKGAVTYAKGRLNDRLILLFGNDDVRGWVQGEFYFEDLLNRKYEQAIKFKKLEFS